jgi:hypothetical protein
MQGPIFGQENELGLVIRDDQADGRAKMLKQVTTMSSPFFRIISGLCGLPPEKA